MKYYFIFLSLIFFIAGVSAASFSPSNLVYLVEKNEESCQVITLESDSDSIEVFDVWAENKDVEWSVGKFDTSASSHGLSLNYDQELSTSEREVEVCVSGSRDGEYRGAIIFKQEQEGNSVVQLAVWLKVVVGEIERGTTTLASSGSGSSGSERESVSEQISGPATTELSARLAEEENLITGSAGNAGESSRSGWMFWIIGIIFIAGLSAFIIYRKNRRPYYFR